MATTPSSVQIIQRTSETVSNVHGWSSGMSLIAGVPFNILLVVMIFHYTPMRLRDYSPIMLQTCFSDLAILFISELVQPVRNNLIFFTTENVFFREQLVLIVDGRLLVKLQGSFVEYLQNPWNNVIYLAWLFCFYFTLYGTIVQFITRYLILNRFLIAKSTVYTFFSNFEYFMS